MKAIILAAGEGVRMRPLTLERPKPLVEVAGKPLLQHIWEILPPEITEVILVIGYKGEMIREFIGENFLGKRVTYVTQEKKAGTADAVRLALPYLAAGERFLLLYADDLHDGPSITRLLNHPLGVLVSEVADPSRFGVMVVDGEGRITDIQEKPEKPLSNLAATGVYLLDRELIEIDVPVHANGESYVTDMICETLKTRPIYTEKTTFWHAIGYPQDVEAAEEILKNR